MSLPSSGSKNKQTEKAGELASCFMLVCRFVYSLTLEMEETCFPETAVTFNGLHGVIFQKTKLATTTAVRTSNPTYIFFIVRYITLVINLRRKVDSLGALF
jgi:hypothetical protein